MHKYIAYENDFVDIGQIDTSTFVSILNISDEIKKNLGLPYQPIRIVSESSVYIDRIIGNFSYGDIRLVILPKVSDDDDFADVSAAKNAVKGFLHCTLRCIGNNLNSTIYFTKSELADDDQGLFSEVLARYYLDDLTRAVRSISIAAYRSYESRETSVKGRILIHKQLSQPATDAKLWCRYKRMSGDNMINALLIWACRFLAGTVDDLMLRKKLLLLTQEFGNVSAELSYQAVSALTLPRQFNVYKECFAIAKSLYLGKKSKKEVSGKKRICGYVISTERAFERIVEKYCSKAANSLGYSHKAQGKCLLANSVSDGGHDFYVKPDDLVFTDKNKLIVDAKYKLFDKGKPKREDFYQMVCSCIALEASEAVLIYPKIKGAKPDSWKVAKTINGKNHIIRSAFIDIFASDEVISDEMDKALEKALFHNERIRADKV